MSSFSDKDGAVRIILGTIAFGMGLDAENVRRIIHWGPSDNLESYIQETGRAGKDGLKSAAILYYNKSDISAKSSASDAMKVYCSNMGLCRRKLLLQDFADPSSIECPKPHHSCCDICSSICDCATCVEAMQLLESELYEEDEIIQELSRADKKERELALQNYRDQLCSLGGSEHVPLFFGKEIISGIPNSLINKIVANCKNINNCDELVDLGVVSEVQASEILTIIKCFQ